MVKSATDIQYGKEFYKEGTELPEHLVKEFEARNPSLLADFIELNGRWFRIDDKGIKGFVEQRKTAEKRLRDYFGIKETPEIKEDKSHMLRARPIPIPSPIPEPVVSKKHKKTKKK